MTKLRLAFSTTTLFVLFLCAAALAQAQIQRTFVSTAGTDAGNCNPSAPCRNFSYALTQTAVGGELIVLTSGGYGVMSITQSVSVIAPDGVYAGVTASSGSAVTVNAPGAVVVLHGLNINRQGTALSGIEINAVDTLYIEKCVVSGFANDGISAFLNASADIFIKDTVSRNNGGNGIFIFGPLGSGLAARVLIVNTRSERNFANGFRFDSRVRATLDQCIALANGNNGFQVMTTTAGTVLQVNAEGCVATHNDFYGFLVESNAGAGTATLRVSRSVSTINGNGFRQSGSSSTFESLQGTNLVRGNSANRTGTITTIDPDSP